jgi:hypothetical protein
VAGLLGALLAWRRRVPAARLYAAALLVAPLMYYFSTTLPRFRHPLEPVLLVLAVYLVQSAEKSWRVLSRTVDRSGEFA